MSKNRKKQLFTVRIALKLTSADAVVEALETQRTQQVAISVGWDTADVGRLPNSSPIDW